MPWINIEKIPAADFRRGFKPAEYHDIIVASRDAKFMFPPIIQPFDLNLQDNAEIVKFFNKNHEWFDFDGNVNTLSRYSFMPGPGEIRPTHVVLRYNLQHQDQQENKVVLKIVHPKYGFQEYARQKKFYDAGYPTPKPYLFINYFSALGALLREKNRELEDLDVIAFLDFLRDVELAKRPFSAYYAPAYKKKIVDILDWLKPISSTSEVALINRYKEDLANMDDGFFSGLEFKGFFFMDFIEKTLSFEQMLFDSLGGWKMEEESGAIDILPVRHAYDPEFLLHDIIDLMLRLWNMGECHNDMKGEHFLYDLKNKRWNIIDWGELVSAGIGQDLAVFLADNNAFIQDRCKFNIIYGRKQGRNIELLQRMEKAILEQNSVFWDIFLARVCKMIPAQPIQDAYHILRRRNLTFHAAKLHSYF